MENNKTDEDNFINPNSVTVTIKNEITRDYN